jgi:hypothetical protein
MICLITTLNFQVTMYYIAQTVALLCEFQLRFCLLICFLQVGERITLE